MRENVEETDNVMCDESMDLQSEESTNLLADEFDGVQVEKSENVHGKESENLRAEESDGVQLGKSENAQGEKYMNMQDEASLNEHAWKKSMPKWPEKLIKKMPEIEAKLTDEGESEAANHTLVLKD